METSPVACYQANRLAIGACWTGLLHAAPPAPAATRAVMTPAMLEFLVDETLDHLADGLRQAGRNRPPHRTLFPGRLRRKGCACGLHLLLIYYSTGARAIHETVPESWGHSRLQIIQCFNDLAHGEVAGLCGACHYRGGAQCQLPAVVAPRQHPASSGGILCAATFWSASRPAQLS